MEYDTELQKNNSLEYGLPDGNIITLKEERFKSPEILFNPSLIGMEEKGLGENAYTSINCDGDRVNIKLCERIVLTGGSSQSEGIEDLAESVFHKQVRVGIPQKISGSSVDIIKNPEFAACVGLIIYAKEKGNDQLAHQEDDFLSFLRGLYKKLFY